MGNLLNSKLFQALSAFYVDTATIQSVTEALTPSGQKILNYSDNSGTWSNVAGMVNLAARITSAGGGEIKSPNLVWSKATHIVHLTGYYPSIDSKMRVVDQTGLAYDILLVNHDSTNSITSLVCQVVS